jgi:hypothetical protein
VKQACERGCRETLNLRGGGRVVVSQAKGTASVKAGIGNKRDRKEAPWRYQVRSRKQEKVRWLTPVILTTQEADVRRISV